MPPIAVPAHLSRFVVEQDYAQYNEVDQAVWRFVLLQMRSRLLHSAHSAYASGLHASGISVERIPNIHAVNEKLAQVGWGAVCVDGFIEPRAFQEFQAAGILPIAAEIRRADHLVYTPAPDIIHEAAGHAPFLPDPLFGAYVRRMGELGRKAFGLPGEARIYRAIHALSELKEDAGIATQRIVEAEEELAAAVASAPPASEATRLSRLYWWTAEYGLVGTPLDYKLYGAGLLSSLWESHACHAPSVKKLPLDESCLDVSYDVTRPQPCLFVTPNFEALHRLVDRVEGTLAFNVGGRFALERALASRELASARFTSGAWVIGTLVDCDTREAAPNWLEFADNVSLAFEGRILPEHLELGQFPRHFAIAAPLTDGTDLLTCSDSALEHFRSAHGHRFEFASGVQLTGELRRSVRLPDGRRLFIELTRATLTLPGRAPLDLARFALVPPSAFASIEAGAVDPGHHPHSQKPNVTVPKHRELPADEQRLLRLFERSAEAHAGGAQTMLKEFPAVHAELEHEFSDEWLLRWNLLESLLKLDIGQPLAHQLRKELEALEVRLQHLQPIATGLHYLAERS